MGKLVRLSGKVTKCSGDPYIGKLVQIPQGDGTGAEFSLVDSHGISRASLGFNPKQDNTIQLPQHLSYLAAGDIIRINPVAGEVLVLFRSSSSHNVIMLTERCNNHCVFCSQPPRQTDDSYLVQDALELLKLVPPSAKVICINGGEPTVAFPGLLSVLSRAKESHPHTALHVLTNGRLFVYPQYAAEIASIGHPDLSFGIPLCSDSALLHDRMVGQYGAFDQTVLGIHNLARYGQHVEIRTVLCKKNIARLKQWAYFVARNFPFSESVAIMGLEMTGLARRNRNGLWCDAEQMGPAITAAIDVLAAHSMNVSIFNLPLCMLPSNLWGYAKKSISDWKNSFSPKCGACSQKDNCGGFFSSWDHAEEIARPITTHAFAEQRNQ